MNTLLADGEFEILFSKEETARFVAALLRHSGAAIDAMAHVDIGKTESFAPEDKATILQEVDDGLGRHKVNQLVIAALNAALRLVAVGEAEASEPTSELRVKVAIMLRDQGMLPEARDMMERLVAAREAAEAAGEGEATATLNAKSFLGEMMRHQGDLNSAAAVLKELVAGWKAVEGWEVR